MMRMKKMYADITSKGDTMTYNNKEKERNMKIQEEVRAIIEKVFDEKRESGGIKHVVWIAAGGSNGGFYPAQYFMDHESGVIRSQAFTSNEFVFATPAFVGKNTLAVVCSMRGTRETCTAAKAAKALGASTVGLYVQESDLTETCDYNIQYESIAVDESRTERVNSSVGLCIAMNLVEITEGYRHYEDAMAAFDIVDDIYRKAADYAVPLAKKWANDNKDEKTIYVMGSGPAWGSAYIFSLSVILRRCFRLIPQLLTAVNSSTGPLKCWIKIPRYSC